MYRFGLRVEKDLKEAEKWWRKAAEQGFAFGLNSLGVMYKYGDGVEKDFVTAYAWFNIAAANGHVVAGFLPPGSRSHGKVGRLV